MTSLVAWETPILSADPSSVDHVRAQHEALRRAGEQAMPDNEVCRARAVDGLNPPCALAQVTRVLFSVLPPREVRGVWGSARRMMLLLPPPRWSNEPSRCLSCA
jgi:hypothetical protein